MLRSLSPLLRSAGKVIESLGHNVAGSTPRSVAESALAARTASNASALKASSAAHFVAPSATLNSPVVLGEGASMWYGVTVDAECSIGHGSCLQDGASVRGAKTTVGEMVVVGPGAVLEGCTLHDGSLVGAGATLARGVTVETDAAVAPGAVVEANTTVKTGELWGGSPAAFIRALDADERAAIAKRAVLAADLAAVHRVECAKDPMQVAEEREELAERDMYYETIREDAEAEWDTFMALPGPGAEDRENSDRRGMIYDRA